MLAQKENPSNFLKNYGNKIIPLCKKYNVKKLWLFGSIPRGVKKANDIDLAVEGVNSRKFWSLYVDLEDVLPKKLDLICAESDFNKDFIKYIKKTGIVIYDKNLKKSLMKYLEK